MIARSIGLAFSFFTFLVLVTPAMAAQVSGRVVDPDDRPVAGARVLLVAAGQPLRSALTNARGEFAIDAPDSGRVELRVAAAGLRSEPLVVEMVPGSRDLGLVRLAVGALSESLVVSAAQVEIPLSQATSSVTVVTAEDIRVRQLHSVADALRAVPGLTVAATGSLGAVTSVFPRGGDSNFTLVLVDDVPVNAFGGDFDFGHLSTENVDRIEIVRGPQSALFGSNAIGAVVRVVTRRGGPPVAGGSIEGGGRDTFRVAASTAGSSGAFEWGASADRLSTDNDTGRVTDRNVRVVNDDYVRTTGAFSAGWRRGETTVRGQLRHATDERGYPGPFGSDPAGSFFGIDEISRGTNDRTLAAASAAFALGRRSRALVQTAYNRIHSDFASSFGPSESNSNRWLGRGQIDFRLTPAVEASAGAELQRERTGSTFITGERGQQVQVKRRTAGYFAEARWNPSSRLSFAGGLRVDDIHRERLEPSPDPFSPRPALASDSVVSVNPRAALSWFARPGTRYTKIRASAATGIRPPDGFELAFTDNPSLKPERSVSVEGAIEQALFEGRVLAEAIVFYNRYEDLIVAVGSFQQSSRYLTDNIANARARGLELGLGGGHRFGTVYLRGRVAYTWLDSEVLAVDHSATVAPPFTVGEPLLRRPRHQVSIETAASTGRLTAFLSGRARGRTLDVEPSSGTFGGLFHAEGFNVWTAGASWRLHRLADVFARIENLFDRGYEEALGFPALGRRASVGLRLAASR